MTVEDTMVSDLPQFYETLSTLSTQCTGNVLGVNYLITASVGYRPITANGGTGQLLRVGVQVNYC